MDDLLDNGPNRNNNDYSAAALPNATAALVLGIVSIVGCFLYGIPGLVCGIIALTLHKKDKTIYLSNPEKYDVSFKTSRAGYVCAIIGTSLSAVYLLCLVIFFAIGISMSRF